MNRLHMLWLVAAVSVALVTGIAVARFGGHDASAQSENQWSIVSAEYICESCSLGSLRPGEGPFEFAQQGDPNGDMNLIINVIAKVEQEGCEWQWVPVQGGPTIIFRCS